MLVVTLLALVAALLVLTERGEAKPRGQCGDVGYPPCPTTTIGSPEAECELSASSGRVGDTIVATVANVPAGTEVQLTFDGQAVASGVAPASGSTKLQGKVPDLSGGSYAVAAVGAGMNLASCGTFGRAEVVGGDAPGRLALTGFQFWALVLVALVLLLVGLMAIRASRHRRRVPSRVTG